MTKKPSTIIKIIVTISLFYYLFFHILDRNLFFSTIQKIQSQYLFYSFLTIIISIFISSYRWKVILSIKDEKVSYLKLVKAYFKGAFFNNFLPGSIGGDLVRSLSIKSKNLPHKLTISSVIIERIIGLIALLLLATAGVFFLNQKNIIIFYSSLCLFFIVMLIFILLIKKSTNLFLQNIVNMVIPNQIAKKINSFIESFTRFASNKKHLLVALLLSIFYRIIEALFIFFLIKGLQIPINFLYTIILFSIVSVIKFIPISLNGLGTSTLVWVYLTNPLGISQESISAVDILAIMISIIVSIIGGIIYLFEKNK